MLKKLTALTLSTLLLISFAACTPAAPASAPAPAPAAPGGDSDFNARLMAAEFSNYLPPNFVVANVTGTGGAIGLRQVADATPDGSSAVMFHSAFVVNQLVGTVDFGFEAYEMAGIIAAHPGMVLLMRADSGISTLGELFEYAKESLTVTFTTRSAFFRLWCTR